MFSDDKIYIDIILWHVMDNNERRRKKYAENQEYREKIKYQERKRYSKNPEKFKKRTREFYEKHKERWRDYVKKSQGKHQKKHRSRVNTILVFYELGIKKEKCYRCGNKKNLEIHHESYPTKREDIKKAIKEKKIMVLCVKCHRRKY